MLLAGPKASTASRKVQVLLAGPETLTSASSSCSLAICAALASASGLSVAGFSSYTPYTQRLSMPLIGVMYRYIRYAGAPMWRGGRHWGAAQTFAGQRHAQARPPWLLDCFALASLRANKMPMVNFGN